jgi:uncharacterized protein (DUF697 family)
MQADKTADQAGELSVKEVPKDEADRIIRHHVWGAMALGLIPVPIADFACVTAVQINLIRKLAKLYGIPFCKERVKNILSPLVGGALPATVSAPLASSITKAVPVVGQAAGIVTMPVVAGAMTYAVGKVFVQHFASGGNFLSFDPEKVKAYYLEKFKEGEQIIAKGKKAAEVPKADEKETVPPKSADSEKAADMKKDESPAESVSEEGTDEMAADQQKADAATKMKKDKPEKNKEAPEAPGK